MQNYRSSFKLKLIDKHPAFKFFFDNSNGGWKSKQMLND